MVLVSYKLSSAIARGTKPDGRVVTPQLTVVPAPSLDEAFERM
jgi:hypothetical protein